MIKNDYFRNNVLSVFGLSSHNIPKYVYVGDGGGVQKIDKEKSVCNKIKW